MKQLFKNINSRKPGLFRLGFQKKEKETIMPIQNKTMLITYSDSLGNNLKDLYENLEKYFGDAVGGVHLLPFFPSTGDRGFAPVDYDQVDPAFGDWEDVKRLGDKYYLMFDFMINHISRQSKYYKDCLLYTSVNNPP